MDKLEVLEEKIDKGFPLEQGTLPGCYNGYICKECSSNKAKWQCTTCKLYFCLDCINGDDKNICDGCCLRCDDF